MSNLFHVLLIPIGLIIVAVALKSSGSAIYRKNVDFKSLDEQIRAEIEQSFWKTLTRLSHFEMGLPARIVVQRMENEEGNTFNDPFLVGNAHEVRAYHYMSEPIDDWCSGVVSRHTQHYFEHKNRRIHVTFDCNRKMALPPLRTTVGWCLVGILVDVVIVIARVLVSRFESAMRNAEATSFTFSTTTIDLLNDKPISFDDYIVDDDDEAIGGLMYMESVEKWDASKLESCYD